MPRIRMVLVLILVAALGCAFDATCSVATGIIVIVCAVALAPMSIGGFGNMPDDSVYHQRNLDNGGEPLTGAKAYRITFPAGQLPPVGALWSITAYDLD